MKRIAIYVGLVLATAVVTSILRPFDALQVLAQPGCRTFSETGQAVCGRFLQYWQEHGGLAQQGYPIGPEFREVSELNGKEYTVQYFERAVFELHPENQPPNDVLLSQLGTYQARRRYGNPPSWQGPPAPPSIQLQPGVSVTLVPKSTQLIPQWLTGLESCQGGGMAWVVRVDNASNHPYTILLDSGYYMADNTGQEYRELKENCGFNLAGEPTHGPYTLQATQSAEMGIYLDASGLSTTATYLELHLSISGTPITFRFNLR
jgi:hypothetical protein